MQIKTRLKNGKALVGKGDNREAAVKDLDVKVLDLLKPVYDRAATAQQRYDRDTNHGLLAAPQAAHRKRQLQLLEELIADLDGLDRTSER